MLIKGDNSLSYRNGHSRHQRHETFRIKWIVCPELCHWIRQVAAPL